MRPMQNMYSCVLFRTKENQYLHVKITLADIPACISTLYLLYLHCIYLVSTHGCWRLLTCACLSRLTRSRLVVRPTVLRCHWARSCTNHSSVLWVCGPIRGQYSGHVTSVDQSELGTAWSLDISAVSLLWVPMVQYYYDGPVVTFKPQKYVKSRMISRRSVVEHTLLWLVETDHVT